MSIPRTLFLSQNKKFISGSKITDETPYNVTSKILGFWWVIIIYQQTTDVTIVYISIQVGSVTVLYAIQAIYYSISHGIHATVSNQRSSFLQTPKKVAACCGQIHPTGSGYLVAYQNFEYAVGHWLQKTAEHVLGCVLCSPGCFSLMRISYLGMTNVMAMYKSLGKVYQILFGTVNRSVKEIFTCKPS